MTENPNPTPGWVATLAPGNPHQDYWEDALRSGFDPWLERIPAGGSSVWVLRSAQFKNATDAIEVKGIAEPIIEQLNGAQNVLADLEPLKLTGVGQVGENGSFSSWVFAVGIGHSRAIVGRATVEVRDEAGNLVAPSPPQASKAQRWMQAARTNDDIADLLRYAGRTDNWYDIYKALELSKRLSGGKEQLNVLLGTSAETVENMRVTANFFRHPRHHRPAVRTKLEEAKPLLALVVKAVLTARLP